jgi:tetratricopeptide (TPR) repeat protein
MLQWRWDEAETEFRRALQISPGYATAHNWYRWFLMNVGRTEEALVEAKRALELDPLSPIINRNLGDSYMLAGDYTRAIEPLRKSVELNPNDPIVRSYLTLTHIGLGAEPEVFECFPGQGAQPEVEAELRATYRDGGGPSVLRKALELRIAETQKHCTDFPVFAAEILAYLRESDRMFECLQDAVDQRKIWSILAHHVFEPYRSDPRFVAILEQMGLEKYLRREGT